MSTTLYEAFLPEVMPDLPGCPEPMVINAIRNAAIEFCERSWAWRVDLDPIDAIANQAVYDLSPPNSSVVCHVIYVDFMGKQLFPATPDQLNDIWRGWRTVKNVQPTYFFLPDQRTIQLVAAPSAATVAAVNMTVALKPTRTSKGLETVVYEEYAEGIAHGAKARLNAQINKEWTDKELSVYHNSMFMESYGMANLSAAKSFTRSPFRTRAHFI